MTNYQPDNQVAQDHARAAAENASQFDRDRENEARLERDREEQRRQDALSRPDAFQNRPDTMKPWVAPNKADSAVAAKTAADEAQARQLAQDDTDRKALEEVDRENAALVAKRAELEAQHKARVADEAKKRGEFDAAEKQRVDTETLDAAPQAPEYDPIAAALEGPGHSIGDRISFDDGLVKISNLDGSHLLPVGVDKLGRVWKIEEKGIVLVGRLNG